MAQCGACTIHLGDVAMRSCMLPVSQVGNYAVTSTQCPRNGSTLLSNAFKFTHAGGSVRGVLRLETRHLQLEVSDTGTGIHPNDLPHIFERYFQTNQYDAPAMGGTGIGLAVCQDYAHLFGGKIAVESALGKGTTFRVEFPVAVLDAKIEAEELENDNAQQGFSPENESAALPLAAAKTDVSPLKPTLLVVEDNPDLQDYFQLILKEKYQVLIAGNGQEALAVIQSGSPQSAVRVKLTHRLQD